MNPKLPALPLRLAILVAATLFHFAVPAHAADDDAEKQAAVAAMESWLQLIDGDDYGTSYDEASPAFKAALTRDAWIAALDEARKPLGGLKSRKLISSALLSTLPDGTKGTYVLAQFESSFANLARAGETVTFERISDGSWLAGGYFIREN